MWMLPHQTSSTITCRWKTHSAFEIATLQCHSSLSLKWQTLTLFHTDRIQSQIHPPLLFPCTPIQPIIRIVNIRQNTCIRYLQVLPPKFVRARVSSMHIDPTIQESQMHHGEDRQSIHPVHPIPMHSRRGK